MTGEMNMPPKAKITKDMILNTVLTITRENGFEYVNARSIAKELNCSTRPIFTCYENMEELKNDFLNFAFDYYNKYVENYNQVEKPKPYLLFPLSYVEFAKTESQLFKLLFISDMDLDMEEANDFYNEIGNTEKATAFSDMLGISLESGKKLFLDLFLYTHGIAVLTATKKLFLRHDEVEKIIAGFLSAFIQRKGE